MADRLSLRPHHLPPCIPSISPFPLRFPLLSLPPAFPARSLRLTPPRFTFNNLSSDRHELQLQPPSLADKKEVSVGQSDLELVSIPKEEKEEEEEEEQQQQQLSRTVLIWRAVKLPIYSVALVPLSVGAAAAYWQTGLFYAGRYCLFLVSSVLVIAWLNLSNDAYDAETGVDKGKKESVVNMTGSRQGVLYAAYTCLLLGITGLVRGSWQAQNMQIMAFLAGAVACGYVYQCPPFRLSYRGLGEPLCFIAFGPLATTAFYLSQASGWGAYSLPITGTILGAAVLVGITTSLILFCSHFHQIEGDRLVGKLSPLVKLGTQQGSKVVKAAIIGLYSTVLVLTAKNFLPFPCAFFSLLTLPVGALVLDFVNKNHENKEKIFLAKYYCVRLHVAFGAALVMGFLTAARMPVMTLR